MTEHQDNERVRLAKEVIAGLDAERFAPRTGNYFYVRPSTNVCAVCAAGALMVACCGQKQVSAITLGPDEDDVMECLTPIFSPSQLALIEAAFEMDDEKPLSAEAKRLGDAPNESDMSAAASLYPRKTTAEQRMRAIMQNIIANGGEFRP